jgi:hypothetical protein
MTSMTQEQAQCEDESCAENDNTDVDADAITPTLTPPPPPPSTIPKTVLPITDDVHDGVGAYTVMRGELQIQGPEAQCCTQAESTDNMKEHQSVSQTAIIPFGGWVVQDKEFYLNRLADSYETRIARAKRRLALTATAMVMAMVLQRDQ